MSKLWITIVLTVIAGMLLTACGGGTASQTIVQTVVVKEPGKETITTITVTPASVSATSRTGGNAAPYNRMIIKNGEMSLRVGDTDLAIDRATSVAVESGGYIISSKAWLQDGFKYATLSMGVPVDQFETAQRRLRALAIQVFNDTASGQDVSDEYVDLQSRLTNLEATAARIREFLQQAKTVKEALDVNAQLTEVEAEIEQLKGRMTYLQDRAAFSTLTINIEPQRPTPTPTPSPTPAAWRPDKTFRAASGTLVNILQVSADMLIWLGVILGPFATPVVIGAAVWLRAKKGKAKRE